MIIPKNKIKETYFSKKLKFLSVSLFVCFINFNIHIYTLKVISLDVYRLKFLKIKLDVHRHIYIEILVYIIRI